MIILTESLNDLREIMKKAHRVWQAEEAKLPQEVQQDPDTFGPEIHEQFAAAFLAEGVYIKAALAFACAVEELILQAECEAGAGFAVH